MMGEQAFTPKQVYHLDWERRIPPDHLLRRARSCGGSPRAVTVTLAGPASTQSSWSRWRS
jgi:hypothetical protein